MSNELIAASGPWARRGVRMPPRPFPGAGRLVRLELHRNAVPWVLPLLAVLFVVTTRKAVLGYQPLWTLRAIMLQNHLLVSFVPFAAGVAAWTGSREGRQHTTDLVTVTARPGWARQGAALAATACWLLVAYLGCVGVLFGVTATQATWGGPPWWPVAVGAALVTALCALGFAAGVLAPHRLTAPLAAVGVLLLMLIGMHYAVNATGGVALLSPVTGVPPFDVGLFYPYLPDLAIDQVIFLAGVVLAAVGLIGLAGVTGARAASASAGRGLRAAAVVVTVAGLAAAGTAAGLAGTARLGAHGVIIPALHDAASDRPIAYTPVCAGTVPVCLHPGYRSYLPSLSAALGPALSAMAGLPGAPTRAVQVATTYQMSAGSQLMAQIAGRPPVLRLYLANVPPPVLNAAASDAAPLRLLAVHAFVGAGAGPGTLAQQAIQAALLRAAGVPLASQPAVVYQAPWSGTRLVPVRGSAMYAAAARFAALPATARHAWLTAHLPALRAAQLTLANLP